MIQTLQSLAGVGGLLLGGTYIIGGLIVNLYLSRYAVTEYQIVRAKYLAVGLVFMVNLAGVLLLIVLPAIGLALLPPFAHQIAFAVGLLAFLWMLRQWGAPDRAPRLVTRWPWRVWLILNVLLGAFPFVAILRLSLGGIHSPTDAILAVEAGIAALLLLTGQVYYYAQFLYGHADAYDPIGGGALVQVQLSGQKADLEQLARLGVAIEQPTLTAPVALIDETPDHYLVGISRGLELRALKVRKEMIQSILYLGYDRPAPPAAAPPEEAGS